MAYTRLVKFDSIKTGGEHGITDHDLFYFSRADCTLYFLLHQPVPQLYDGTLDDIVRAIKNERMDSTNPNIKML